MSPFDLPIPATRGVPGACSRIAARTVAAALGLSRLRRVHDQLCGENVAAESLRLMRIGLDVTDASLAHIPDRGPALLVANHPYGAADGLALMAAAERRRADVKLLANHLLLRIPELREHVIAVDPFARNHRCNLRGLRQARRWLLDGGALIVFPAGEVSSVVNADGRIVDPPWHRGILALAEWTAAAVVPAFIHGENRRLFRWAGRIHPLLRTALLPREFLARRGQAVRISIGAPVSIERLQRFRDADARLAYLRARTYSLGSGHDRIGSTVGLQPRAGVPIAKPEPLHALAAEVAALPDSARLVASGALAVYCSAAAGIPHVLREIGRLREQAFRAIGEGAGHERDLDRFDRSYLHLFLWHADRRQVVGAYRLGLTDRLGAASDPHVLYSRTLFRYGPRLMRDLSSAIELGRSFIRPEYQREPNALLLLWRGIGTFVAREPRYRYLFGPVSMSADYQSFTRQLVARYLSGERFLSHLAHMVRPARPPVVSSDVTQLVRSRVVSSLDDVEALVREVEGGRGLPVLLRQYLKLNARLLGFSVDPQFGNVLDGLIVVDLLEVKPALLQRYLGREGAAAFLDFHARDRQLITVPPLVTLRDAS